jgi:hypothetical protein
MCCIPGYVRLYIYRLAPEYIYTGISPVFARREGGCYTIGYSFCHLLLNLAGCSAVKLANAREFYE